MMDVAQQKLPPSGPRVNAPRAHLEILRWLIVAGFVVMLVLLYSRNQAEILQIQYQMEQVEADNQRLATSNDNLRAEYKLLSSPQRILEKAEELGLISANQPQVRIIQAPARSRPGKSLLAAAQKPRRVLSE